MGWHEVTGLVTSAPTSRRWCLRPAASWSAPPWPPTMPCGGFSLEVSSAPHPIATEDATSIRSRAARDECRPFMSHLLSRRIHRRRHDARGTQDDAIDAAILPLTSRVPARCSPSDRPTASDSPIDFERCGAAPARTGANRTTPSRGCAAPLRSRRRVTMRHGPCCPGVHAYCTAPFTCPRDRMDHRKWLRVERRPGSQQPQQRRTPGRP